MKVIEYTQEQAKGFFDANSKPVVTEFMLGNEVLVVAACSNSQAHKYIDWLKEDQKFTNRGVTDLGYQAFLLENARKAKDGSQERALGFIGKNIPEGESANVTLRITICETKEQTKSVSKLYRDTRLPKVRTNRRAVPVAKNTMTKLSLLRPNESLIIDAGCARNVVARFA